MPRYYVWSLPEDVDKQVNLESETLEEHIQRLLAEAAERRLEELEERVRNRNETS